MEGPSFVTVLLHDEVNNFIPLRFLAAAPQLMTDAQIASILESHFLNLPLLEISADSYVSVAVL